LKIACLTLTAIAFLTAVPASADIYIKRSPDGQVMFTDTPTSEDFTVLIKTDAPSQPQSSQPPPPSGDWKEYTNTVADFNQLDPDLVHAVITVESGGNPDAVSCKGAMGLMQLMPGTADELGVEDPMEPTDNIRGGVKYLADLIDRFDGNLEYALAAYNAGPGAVQKYGGIPPYLETRQFVKKVLANYRNRQK
jgi:soluble lytic murein transglycosylase